MKFYLLRFFFCISNFFGIVVNGAEMSALPAATWLNWLTVRQDISFHFVSSPLTGNVPIAFHSFFCSCFISLRISSVFLFLLYCFNLHCPLNISRNISFIPLSLIYFNFFHYIFPLFLMRSLKDVNKIKTKYFCFIRTENFTTS